MASSPTTASIVVRAGGAPDVERFLVEKIYEYNAAATGYRDAESFTAVKREEAGAVEAGISGYTWGGCCYVSYLWVAEASRGRGHGTALLDAVEQHARVKRCRVVLLSSHSFQAPGFYARRGYEQVGRIDDHPVGHSSFFFTKRLDVQ
jgi:GNAT superfamily N-acetyltransferase